MARRKKQKTDAQIQSDKEIALELIRSALIVIQDPLISSLAAWWWIQKRSDLGWDDRTALRLGVVDINGARANVDRSIVLQTMGMATDLVKGLGSALTTGFTNAGLTAAAASGGPEVAAAAIAAKQFSGSSPKSRSGRPSEDEIEDAWSVLSRAGVEIK